MRHYTATQAHVMAAPPVVSKLCLLRGRAEGLKAMIRVKLAGARRSKKPADVRELSATLRAVKAEIATLEAKKRDGKERQ